MVSPPYGNQYFAYRGSKYSIALMSHSRLSPPYQSGPLRRNISRESDRVPVQALSSTRTANVRSNFRPVTTAAAGATGRPSPNARHRMVPTFAQLNPEQRQRVYNEVMESNRPFLCRHLNPTRHYAYLRSKRHFDLSTVQKLNHCVTTAEKVDLFIDELVRAGPRAVPDFMDSLERNRVESNILQTLADALQTFRIQDLDIDEGNLNLPGSRLSYDFDNETPSDDERQFSDEMSSLRLNDGDSYQAVAAAASVNVGLEEAVMPPIDINQLRAAQGLCSPESMGSLDPEEASDMSSIDGLISHGYQD